MPPLGIFPAYANMTDRTVLSGKAIDQPINPKQTVSKFIGCSILSCLFWINYFFFIHLSLIDLKTFSLFSNFSFTENQYILILRKI
jgi:hypothetical protein